MSRSRRKTPFAGVTTATSDKPFKKAENSRHRQAVRRALERDEEPPPEKLFGDPWHGEKDGKFRIGRNSARMRK